ncbi:syntaxin-binding protein 1 [Paragonimus westermani]|uniref:Syntaxin-binding protein 1 n=1 Tax=Paragonimus westermani TaxID=34504 RepID=A0A5J4NKR6_9TREM|nr:syntaxin-binding protein 1 [Paragonimus westermani]
MSLQTDVALAFRKHVFERLQKQGYWKILILDKRATQVINTVYRMQDLTDLGITLVESLYCVRKPFNMEAIYIMYPHRREVELLLRDFSSQTPTYSAAHVFFLLPCPRDVLDMIRVSNCFRYIKTLAQLDLDFIPVESSVYTFNSPETGQMYCLPPHMVQAKQNHIELLAEQLATVCVTLQEYPQICYRKSDMNLELARLIQLRLDAARQDNPGMGQGLHKDKSILLILDRGFDPLSPLLHELTLQAMCYDLLTIVDNAYKYGNNRKAHVTEQDFLWKDLRHLHIADVTRILPQRIREFSASKKQFMSVHSSKKSSPSDSPDAGLVSQGASNPKEAMGLRELSNLIKRLPQYQEEFASYTGAYSITEACMDIFRRGVDKLCEVEQDLVMGKTAQGEVLRDPMRTLSAVLQHDFTSVEDRLRLLMIFVLIKDGISESHLEKLLSSSDLDRSNKILFASLSLLLGAQLIQPEAHLCTSDFIYTRACSQHTLYSCLFENLQHDIQDGMGQPTGPQTRFSQLEFLQRLPPLSTVSERVQCYLPMKGKRKDRVDSNSYAVSRWTPYLMDILEEAIGGHINKSNYAFLVGKGTGDLHGLGPQPEQSTKNFRGPSARFQPSGNPSSTAGSRPNTLNNATRSNPFFNLADRTGSGRPDHCGPRLIVCIVGGVTWSEARTAYQLTEKCVNTRLAESDRHTGARGAPAVPGTGILQGGGGIGWNWEVLIGGTHMITPNAFIGDLDNMSRFFFGDTSASSQTSSDHAQPRKSSLTILSKL